MGAWSRELSKGDRREINEDPFFAVLNLPTRKRFALSPTSTIRLLGKNFSPNTAVRPQQ
jgi:hypothetical protein